MPQSFATPREHTHTHTPSTAPPLEAAPDRFPPELAPQSTVKAKKIERTSTYAAYTSIDVFIWQKPDASTQNINQVFYKYDAILKKENVICQTSR